MSSYIPFNDARTLLLAASLVTSDRVHFSNEPFEQPDTGLWLSVEAYSEVLNVLDIGGNVYEERGRVMIYCIAQFGVGTDDLRTLAKNVCNVYRGLGPRNPFYSNCSIGVGTPSEGGDVYVIPVSVSFTYQDLST